MVRPLQQRIQESEERIEKIIELLRSATSSPAEIASLLAEHYKAIANESMYGFTHNPDCRDYWRKFSKGYAALASKFRKIED